MKKLLGLLTVLAALAFASPSFAANRFAVCTTTCTWDGASTAMWSTTTGGATGASVPGSADAVILDAATCVGGTTCTITVNTNPNIVSLTMGTCTATTTGCVLNFSVNNNSMTVQTVSISGTGTRTLELGSGTFTLTTSTGAPWDALTTTGLTFNAGTSTIAISTTSANFLQFNSGGLTYNTITITDTSGCCFMLWNGNSATIGTLVLSAKSRFALNASPLTVSTTFTSNGTSTTPIIFKSNDSTTAKSITVPAGTTMSWTALSTITFTTNTPTCNNCFNLGGVTNATINPPVVGGGGHIIGG